MKSCLTIIVLIVVAGFVYNLYRTSQESTTPTLEGEYSPQFRKAVIASIEDYLFEHPNIDRVSQDGSIIDIHYKNRVARNQYRLDATTIAESFSKTKLQLLDNGDVLVRCIINNLILLEVTAENGQVIKITEL